MSSDDGALGGSIFMNFVLAIAIFLLFLSDNLPRSGYFYVRSGNQGYEVVMDDWVAHTTSITKPMDLNDAKRMCDALNVTLGDKANK